MVTTPAEGLTDASWVLSESLLELPYSLRGLHPSAEPAVVLSSLARCCVPSFSDACTVELSEGTDQDFRVSYPLPGDEPEDDAAAVPPNRIVTTSFEMRSCHGWPAFAGVIAHGWSQRVPTPSDGIIARLLVHSAIALVRQVRLEELAAAADERSAKLALEAITNKTIGEAAGIVMATRGVTCAHAFEILRHAARQADCDVYDIGVKVVCAGRLEGPADVSPGPNRPGPSRTANIYSLPGCEP